MGLGDRSCSSSLPTPSRHTSSYICKWTLHYDVYSWPCVLISFKVFLSLVSLDGEPALSWSHAPQMSLTIALVPKSVRRDIATSATLFLRRASQAKIAPCLDAQASERKNTTPLEVEELPCVDSFPLLCTVRPSWIHGHGRPGRYVMGVFLSEDDPQRMVLFEAKGFLFVKPPLLAEKDG